MVNSALFTASSLGQKAAVSRRCLAIKGKREIAGFPEVSIKIAESYHGAILRKLGIDSVAGLVRIAIREGLVSLDS